MTIKEIRKYGKSHPGVKLVHRYFTDEEFVMYDLNGELVDEMGLVLSESMFWEDQDRIANLSDGWKAIGEIPGFIKLESTGMVELLDPREYFILGYQALFIAESTFEPCMVTKIVPIPGKYYGLIDKSLFS